MAPPIKRQKRFIALGSDNEDSDAKPKSKPVPTASRAKPTKTNPRGTSGSCTTGPLGPNTLPKDHGAKLTFAGNAQTSRPISFFFRAETQAQKLSNQKPPEAATPDPEDHEDLIIDDSSIENVDNLGEPPTRVALDGRKKRPAPRYNDTAAKNKLSLQGGSQQFKMPEDTSSAGTTPGTSGGAKGKSNATDMRPWAEKYGPITLEELMVHKKKVSDVRKWLEDALSGRDYRVCSSRATAAVRSLTLRKRVLILKGPSGAGKTATISMLAKAMDVDILEWKNPLGSQVSSEAYLSMSDHFEDFLGRSGKFNRLALADRNGNVPATPTQTTDALGEKTRERIILMEEFPSTFLNTPTALRSFRSSVLQHLASNTPSTGVIRLKQQDEFLNITPMVMIITETRLPTTFTTNDSFTAHRLLGPDLLSHPCLSTIEFNPIASTYITKALDLVVQKEARQTGRRKVPGPAVLKKLGEVGDIRSAIGSLEFLCLRGEYGDDWGGRVASRAKKGANALSTLTKMEKNSLAVVTQRESTLGLFHAVAKVVYNKRDEFTDSGAASEPPVHPPHHLFRHVRPRITQVSADQLIEETGTDVETFVAALHENFVLSCEGKSFADSLNGCIDALSDSDILGSRRGGRYGSAGERGNSTFPGAPSDTLRQDEIRFQVAVRGLLFSLPDPVRRRTHPVCQESGGRSDAYKMFYPTSIRVTRQMEEIEGLMCQWTDKLRSSAVTLGKANGRHGRQSIDLPSRRILEPSKVTARNLSRSDEDGPEPFRTCFGYTKNELIIERLPYITKIEQRKANSTQLSGLEAITKFHIVTLGGNEVLKDENVRQETPLSDWTTDGPTEGNVTDLALRADLQQGVGQASEAVLPVVLPVEEEVEQLYLSDDDIEDD